MFPSTDTQAQWLVNVFLGRRSDYAVQTDEGRYRRVGSPITLQVVRDHLDGRFTMGTYVMDEQGDCSFAVFDADQADGLRVLANLQRRLAAAGICSYLEVSRRGAHLWVFLAAAAPAWAVRRWLLPYCPAGVEFYPKQDETSGYGSLIRVPLGVHRRSGKRYTFVRSEQGKLVPLASTMTEVFAVIQAFQRVTVPQVCTQTGSPAEPVPTHPSQTKMVPMSPGAGYASISAWCAAQDPFEVIGRYVSLDRHGLGHCPFPEHHRNGVDRHPSFQVYQPKRPGGGCWRCYAGEVSGNVFNFLQLYHGLTAAALWAQLSGRQG